MLYSRRAPLALSSEYSASFELWWTSFSVPPGTPTRISWFLHFFLIARILPLSLLTYLRRNSQPPPIIHIYEQLYFGLWTLPKAFYFVLLYVYSFRIDVTGFLLTHPGGLRTLSAFVFYDFFPLPSPCRADLPRTHGICHCFPFVSSSLCSCSLSIILEIF